jgi:hypothetical protein
VDVARLAAFFPSPFNRRFRALDNANDRGRMRPWSNPRNCHGRCEEHHGRQESLTERRGLPACGLRLKIIARAWFGSIFE